MRKDSRDACGTYTRLLSAVGETAEAAVDGAADARQALMREAALGAVLPLVSNGAGPL